MASAWDDRPDDIAGDEARWERLAERICPTPRETRSLQDYERLRHRDLPLLPDEDLELEAFRVLLRACLGPPGLLDGWLGARRAAVKQERARRQAARRAARPEPMPAPLPFPRARAAAGPRPMVRIVGLNEAEGECS